MNYSVVVPAYNEMESVQELYKEIVSAPEISRGSFEIIFVDDGSTDATAEKLLKIQSCDRRVRLIRFVRNFGKSAAYAAAFRRARGAIVITLDGDLQDDPAEIPKLLRRIDEGCDLVVGWKQRRFENEPRKTVPSKVFNRLMQWTFGLKLHDSNSGFRAMRLRTAQQLDLYGDMYRFIPQLAHLKGFRVSEEGVGHRRRLYGRSKYGSKRFWTGLLDLLAARFVTRFSKTPLHFLGSAGLVPFALGLFLELYVLTLKLMGDTFQTHIAAIVIGVMLMTVGFQCIVAGLLGELLTAQRPEPSYILAADSGGTQEPLGDLHEM